MSNVVQLRPSGEAVKITEREHLMNMIARDLHNHDLELLSNRIGVSRSCLYAIRNGRTRWPRHATLLTLIHMLGYELWLVRS